MTPAEECILAALMVGGARTQRDAPTIPPRRCASRVIDGRLLRPSNFSVSGIKGQIVI
jgi:hypothetical protein